MIQLKQLKVDNLFTCKNDNKQKSKSIFLIEVNRYFKSFNSNSEALGDKISSILME